MKVNQNARCRSNITQVECIYLWLHSIVFYFSRKSPQIFQFMLYALPTKIKGAMFSDNTLRNRVLTLTEASCTKIESFEINKLQTWFIATTVGLFRDALDQLRIDIMIANTDSNENIVHKPILILISWTSQCWMECSWGVAFGTTAYISIISLGILYMWILSIENTF